MAVLKLNTVASILRVGNSDFIAVLYRIRQRQRHFLITSTKCYSGYSICCSVSQYCKLISGICIVGNVCQLFIKLQYDCCSIGRNCCSTRTKINITSCCIFCWIVGNWSRIPISNIRLVCMSILQRISTICRISNRHLIFIFNDIRQSQGDLLITSS